MKNNKKILRVKISQELIEECTNEVLTSFYQLKLLPIHIEYDYVREIYSYCFWVSQELIEEYNLVEHNGEYSANIII